MLTGMIKCVVVDVYEFFSFLESQHIYEATTLGYSKEIQTPHEAFQADQYKNLIGGPTANGWYFEKAHEKRRREIGRQPFNLPISETPQLK